MSNYIDKIKGVEIDWSFIGVLKAFSYFFAVSFSATLSYIDIRQEVIYAISLAMVFDSITGALKARKLGIPPTSKEGKKGIFSKIILLTGVLLMGLIAKLLGVDLKGLVYSALLVLTIYEVYSFFGNIAVIHSGKDIPEVDAVSAVIKFIRLSLKRIIDQTQDPK